VGLGGKEVRHAAFANRHSPMPPIRGLNGCRDDQRAEISVFVTIEERRGWSVLHHSLAQMDAAYGRVRALEILLRDYVTDARFHYALYHDDRSSFHVICSALDVIGDTTMAIDAYLSLPDERDHGVLYLQLYGVLQALQIQQDAVQHILDTLKIQCATGSDDLRDIREIRNMATGHPAKRERNRKHNRLQSSHKISRPSLSQESFLLFSHFEDGKSPMEPIMVLGLIEKQEKAIAARMHGALVELRRREVEHRMKYRDKKLASLFPATIEYYFEKCYEGCRENDDNGRRTFAQMHAELLVDILGKFKDGLTERGLLPACDHIGQDIADVEYPLREFEKYLRGDTDNTLNAQSARIFVFFMQHHFRTLREYAEGFDREYMEDPPPVDTLP